MTATPIARRSSFILSIALLATLLLGTPAPVRAVAPYAELWVAQRGAASAPGSSCSNPGYKGKSNAAIQAAIDDAADNAVIHLCPGRYAITATLEITGIAVTLGGAGAKTTILDGGATVRKDGTWVSGGVQILDTDDDLIVEELTFQNGLGGYGGAISAGGAMNIIDSTFTKNSTDGEGGAVYSEGALYVLRSTFTKNSAVDYGGAIDAYNTVTIVDSTFTKNHCDGTGGAVWNTGGDATILNSTFTKNSADEDGGALWINRDAFVANSTFTKNRTAANGGAVYGWDSATVTASTFTKNSAANAGGAVYSPGDATVTASTFTKNNGTYGGAVYTWGDATVTASVFTKNSAVYTGGAIWIYSPNFESLLASIGNTFAKNRVEFEGSALYLLCGDYEGTIAYFRTVNTLRRNSSTSINSPSVCP
jgi:predicted outer membrane repeat protein